jgi:periplasmic protein TonB
MNVVAPRVSQPAWSAPRWTWSSVFLATMITASLFVALPLLEKYMRDTEAGARLRPVDTVALPPPPPPPPPPARPPEENRPQRPRPVMQQMTPRVQPLPLSVALGMELDGIQGDFSYAFNVGDVSGDSLVFEIDELDQVPRAVVALPPRYPPQARQRRIEGEVLLEFVVEPDGTITQSRVIESNPPGMFEDAALRAVFRWRFEPGQMNGEAVATRVRQPVTFRLE